MVSHAFGGCTAAGVTSVGLKFGSAHAFRFCDQENGMGTGPGAASYWLLCRLSAGGRCRRRRPRERAGRLHCDVSTLIRGVWPRRAGHCREWRSASRRVAGLRGFSWPLLSWCWSCPRLIASFSSSWRCHVIYSGQITSLLHTCVKDVRTHACSFQIIPLLSVLHVALRLAMSIARNSCASNSTGKLALNFQI